MAKREKGERADKPRARQRLRWGLAVILVAAVCSFFLVRGGCGESLIVKADEQIVLFPTAARLRGDGRGWIVPIHGWIYEPETDEIARRTVVAAIRKALDVDDLGPARAILEQRLSPFLVDNERGKVVTIRIGDTIHALEPSDQGGHIQGEVVVPIAQAKELAQGQRLPVEVVLSADKVLQFDDVVHLIGPAGTSVISDIDDTIKVTAVRDRRELIRNTFLRGFQEATGMSATYRRWAREGVVFHYVSSSPWQLAGHLQEFLRAARFPEATMSLKRFRLTDSSVLDLLDDPLETKPRAIERILKDYPQRRFCLIGDSGEKDPEVYGHVARLHPARILAIYIRDVTGDARDSQRYTQAFEGLPPALWTVFTDPSALSCPPIRE